MQKYKYVAVNLQKQKIKGTFIAKDEKDLAEQLAKQSLYLISVAPYSGNTPSAFFTTGTGKVKLSELTTFCRQFAIMINANIPILDCLDVLKNQNFSGYFRKILEIIYEDVKSGFVLSEALDKHAKVFPDFFRSMITVGEASGKLEIVFTSLADYYEKDSAIKNKAKSAMAYPLMLMGMTVAIVVLMLAMVIPRFRSSLSKLEIEITGLTKVIYNISDYLLGNWQTLVLGIILVGGLLFLFLKTEKGKFAFDWFKIKAPLIGPITTNMVTARFARAFSLLLSSGMTLSEALDAVEIIIGNRYLKKKFRVAADGVRHGMTLTNAFDSNRLFPDMMIQMVAVGESSNTLEEVLLRSCAFFDVMVETSLNKLTSKLQPIMLIIMGAVIGTLFLAVYAPMLTIMTTI